MTTATLRPNATIANSGSVVGAASAHAATSDDSDSSYVLGSSSSYNLGTSTLPTGAVTKQARMRWRGRADSTGDTVDVRLKSGTSTLALHGGTSTTSTATYSGAYAPVTLTQAEVDALTVAVTSVSTLRLMELYADVVYVEKPVTVVTAVSPDPYTASSEVPIAWTNTLDADGGAQTYYQVKVFDDATYGGGGFAATTSTAFWESGNTASSAGSATTGALPNDTYRAYVRVAQTVNGTRLWSSWAYDEFTVTVPDAEVDTVTMAASNANGLIQVTVARVALSEAWEFVEVQRSIDAGVTWAYVRGAAYVDSTGNANSFVVDDYEVANGQAAKYRARATRLSSGLQIVGPWVESASTATWSSTTDCWLKAPDDPSLNTTFSPGRTSASRTRRAGVFNVIGSRLPVVVSDVRSGFQGTLPVNTSNAAEHAALKALLAGSDVILVQYPSAWDIADAYVTVTEDDEEFLSLAPTQLARTWSFAVVEVAAPADPDSGV